jgi:hypothetical protein
MNELLRGKSVDNVWSAVRDSLLYPAMWSNVFMLDANSRYVDSVIATLPDDAVIAEAAHFHLRSWAPVISATATAVSASDTAGAVTDEVAAAVSAGFRGLIDLRRLSFKFTASGSRNFFPATVVLSAKRTPLFSKGIPASKAEMKSSATSACFHCSMRSCRS